MLRFITPETFQENGLLIGSFPKSENDSVKNETATVYANNLTFNFSEGKYQFRNDSDSEISAKLHQISNDFTRDRLTKDQNSLVPLLVNLIDFGSNINSKKLWEKWLEKVNQWYFTILDDELNGLTQLQTLNKAIDDGYFLKSIEINDTVTQIVNSTTVIDLHTHLFPQSHGNLILYGVDELLTYHYLVAEYFMVAPTNVVPESKEFLNFKYYASRKEKLNNVLFC